MSHQPSIGRNVLFWRSGYEGICLDAKQPMAAKIALVHNEQCVNLSVTDHAGNVFPVSGVLLVQDGDAAPGQSRPWCEWMP